MLRAITTIGNPVLRAKARPVSRAELGTPALESLIDDLVDTMHHANGAGIAAPQVGESIRVCTIHVQDNPRYPYKPNIPLTVLLNPVIEPIGEETFDNYEGCLSVPNLRGLVRRAVHVRVRAWDRTGRDLEFEARGLAACTYQHEVDHLDGTLFVDRVEDRGSLSTWADFDRFHKQAFVARAEALVARFGQ